MDEWSVYVEATTGASFEEADAEALLEALDGHAPAVSFGHATAAARFSVDAGSAQEAAWQAAAMFLAAYREGRIIHLDVQSLDDLDGELARSELPAMVGVAEIAASLGVTRQRASSIARKPNFPTPFSRLAAGPIWSGATVARYTRMWKRLPGRPAGSGRGTGMSKRQI